MRVGRNDPCPCGSGKKYKRCCGGLSSVPVRQKPQLTRISNIPALAGSALPEEPAGTGERLPFISQNAAYSGTFGKRRETFCREYTTSKMARIAEIENELRKKAGGSGKAISCRDGCAHCCRYPVDASLQECECIAYYLYQHEDVLKRFLLTFGIWRESIMRIEPGFRQMQALSEKIMSDKATGQEIELFYDRCGAYGLADIPCPFLEENSCSIYPVRPYVCAGVVATTPGEWCHSAHPDLDKVENVKVPFELETDMPYFAAPAGSYFYSSMPFLVFRLLNEGPRAVADMPVLEN